MKKSDVNALEKTLFQLPTDQKYYIANQLLNQINAQAQTLLETSSSHHQCPHCNHQHVI